MAGPNIHAAAVSRRSFRLTMVVVLVLALALLWFGLAFAERGGPSPVRDLRLINGTRATTTTVAPTSVPAGPATTQNGAGQNCKDNDQHVGEGTPADILADMSNGNGNGGDGCPSGI